MTRISAVYFIATIKRDMGNINIRHSNIQNLDNGEFRIRGIENSKALSNFFPHCRMNNKFVVLARLDVLS